MARGIYAIVWLCKWSSLLLVAAAFWYSHTYNIYLYHQGSHTHTAIFSHLVKGPDIGPIYLNDQQNAEYWLYCWFFLPAAIPYLIFWQIQDFIKNRFLSAQRKLA